MSNFISLRSIIIEVVEGKGFVFDDSFYRLLLRKFKYFVENIGGDISVLKRENRSISFDESEKEFVKLILGELLDDTSTLAKLAEKKGMDVTFDEFNAATQTLINKWIEIDENRDELDQLTNFLDRTFFCMPLFLLKKCHELVDIMFVNIQDSLVNKQTTYLTGLYEMLTKEFALTTIEAATDALEISEFINFYNADSESSPYSQYGHEIKSEYIRRDTNFLNRIQNDDDLRIYIEKKLGRRVEDVFNYINT